MSYVIENVTNHVFINGVWGSIVTKGYFHCQRKTAPTPSGSLWTL